MAHLQMSSLSLRATSYMLQLQAAASVVILRHRFDIVRYRADDICTITGRLCPISYRHRNLYRTDIATMSPERQCSVVRYRTSDKFVASRYRYSVVCAISLRYSVSPHDIAPISHRCRFCRPGFAIFLHLFIH